MDGSGFELRSLLSRRGVAATALFLLVIAAVATMPRLLGPQIGRAVAGLGDARPVWLWLAASAFVGSVLCSASAWRAAVGLCGGRMSRSDATARYGVGSLVNSLSPVRIGEAIRLALFARSLEGGDRAWRMGGVFAAITALRSLVFAVVVVIGAATGALPLWPVLLLGGLVAAAGVAAFVARDRRPRSRVAHLLDAFREVGRSPREAVRIGGWIVAGTACRFAAAIAIAAALGVDSPVSAALIIVPTLDLAGLIPLSGNLGITSGAVVMALQAHGVGLGQALATGLAFHAVETGAGLLFGVASALLLTHFESPVARRRMLVVSGAGVIACLVAAFATTVLLPLA